MLQFYSNSLKDLEAINNLVGMTRNTMLWTGNESIIGHLTIDINSKWELSIATNTMVVDDHFNIGATTLEIALIKKENPLEDFEAEGRLIRMNYHTYKACIRALERFKEEGGKVTINILWRLLKEEA